MSTENIFKLIVENTRKVLPVLKDHEFEYGDKLKDLGANSLDRSDIIEATMEDLSLDIARVELFDAKNIGELAELLHRKNTN